MGLLPPGCTLLQHEPFYPPKGAETKAKEPGSKAIEPDDKEKTLLAYIDKKLNGTGFVKWQPFDHPTLGKVEIGGFAPFVTSTPPAAQIDSLCKMQLPWLLKLTTKLPDLHLLKELVTALGAGVYKLEIFVENRGTLPYPTAMGSKNKQPAPVIVILEGENFEFLEGYNEHPWVRLAVTRSKN